ncbi:MAG: hypothetical protein LH615_15390, partial [Ferruginibacter sp.]|nr:hypothetical protein [Ferruginibacter sp.]
TREPEVVEVRGNKLVCQICSSDKFWNRNAQLNTSVASFFGFDWANKSATCFVCADCTYVYWFLG